MIPGRQDPSQRRDRIEAAIAARGGPGGGPGGGPSRLGAWARGAGQGFTVGMSDEMMGGMRAAAAMVPGGMSPGEAYTAGTEGARARNRASREAFPWSYGAAEVAGSVAPMVGAALMTAPAGGAGGAAVAGSTGARILAGGARVARGAATRPGLGAMSAQTAARPFVGGGVEGALQAFGHAEGSPLERLPSTIVGGGVGLAAGGLAQGVTRAGGYMGGRVMDLTGTRAATSESAEGVAANFLRRIPGTETIQQQAQRRVARALPEGGQLTPDPAGQGPGTFEGRELQGAVELLEAHPERAVMDVSQQTRGLARGATAIPGRAKEDIPAFLRERHAGQEERLIDQILELSDQNTRQAFRESTEEIMARQKATAAPLYEAAHKAPDGSLRTVSRDVVHGEEGLLDIPAFQEAYERGVRIAKLEGVDLPPLTDDLIEIPVQAIDYMKQGLDDAIQGGQAAGRGMQRREARALRENLNTMLERVDEAVPEFGQARAAWKGGFEEQEALEVGQNLFKKPGSEARYALEAMGENERELFLRGGVEAFAELLEKIPSGRDLTMARPLADRTADVARMRMLFPSDEAFESFQRQVTNEVQMASTNRFINQQSATAPIMLEVADLVGVDMAGGLAGGGGVPAMLLRAGREALRGRQTSYSGDVAEQMTPLLTAQGQDAAALTRRLMGPQRQSIMRETVTAGAPTLAGSTLAGAGVGRSMGITDDQRAYLLSRGMTAEEIEREERELALARQQGR